MCNGHKTHIFYHSDHVTTGLGLYFFMPAPLLVHLGARTTIFSKLPSFFLQASAKWFRNKNGYQDLLRIVTLLLLEITLFWEKV